MRAPFPAFLAALCLATGCATTLTMHVIEPPLVNVGAARKLSIVQVEGGRQAWKEALMGTIGSGLKVRGYFKGLDRTTDRISLTVNGDVVNVSGALYNNDEVFVRLDILQWDQGQELREETAYTQSGKAYQTKVVYDVAHVVFAATTANLAGADIRREYEGERAQKHGGYTSPLQDALDDAVATFLHNITPALVDVKVRVDSSDKRQAEAIELARTDKLDEAIAKQRAFVALNPDLPSALYNLAVYLDAHRDYAEALQLYDRAIAAAPELAYYADTREEAKARAAKFDEWNRRKVKH